MYNVIKFRQTQLGTHIVEECPVFNTTRLGILGVRGGMRPAEIAPRRILEFVLVSEVKEALEENITEDLVKNKQT